VLFYQARVFVLLNIVLSVPSYSPEVAPGLSGASIKQVAQPSCDPYLVQIPYGVSLHLHDSLRKRYSGLVKPTTCGSLSFLEIPHNPSLKARWYTVPRA